MWWIVGRHRGASPLPRSQCQPQERRGICGRCGGYSGLFAGKPAPTGSPPAGRTARCLCQVWWIFRPLRGQARFYRLTASRKNDAVPVGAGLPAKRPEQTIQKNNSNLGLGFGFGESAAISLLLILMRAGSGDVDSRLQEAELRCLKGQVRSTLRRSQRRVSVFLCAGR